MQLIRSRKTLPVFGLWVLLLNLSPVVFSAAVNHDLSSSSTSMTQQSDILILAGVENIASDDEQPRSGSLVLPAAASTEEKSEKKCMTVCQRLGQECMIDTTRGVRKCRRTCKEFGQECF